MLTTTAPVFASGEDIPPIEPEDVEIDEPIVLDELEEPIVSDELAIADEAAEAEAVEEATETVETRLRGIDTFDALQSAINGAIDGDTITLAANIDIDSSITINKKLTLDLNGCTLTSNTANKAISIADGGDLTVVDNSTDPTGKILETKTDPEGISYAVYVEAGGTLTLESGAIEYSGTRGYAVGCKAGASMTINGGTVKGGYGGISNSGTLTITGGSVSGVSYGIVASKNSTVTMSDGTVTGAYGIYNSGTFTMSGGTVTGTSYGIYNKGTLTMSDGEVSSDQYAFYNYTNAKITLNGGTVKIDSDNSEKYFCAIISYGTLEINNGTVEAIANGSPNTQGVRCVYNAGKLTMKDGTIRGVFNSTNDEMLDYPPSVQGIACAKGSVTEINGGIVEGVSNKPAVMAPYGINCYGNLTINDGIVRAENGTGITGRGTGDYDGTVYTINGGTITGELGIYHPQDGYMEINGGTITGSLTGIEIRAGEMVVNGGKITGNATYFQKDENGTGSTTIGAGIAVVQHDTQKKTTLTVNDGAIYGYVPLFEGNVHKNPDEAIELVELKVTGGLFQFVDTDTDLDNPDRKAVITEDVDHYMTGGIYSSKIPYEYIHPDYYRRHLHDNVYGGAYDDHFEVTKPQFTVNEIARTIDAEVDLVDLIKNDGVDGEPFSTYKVILAKSSDNDAKAINEFIDTNPNDTNTQRSVFDILVQKTDDDGVVTYITDDILDQKITVTLINANDAANVHVYYIDKKDSNTVKEIEDVVVNGNQVTFTAPMLSTHAITYNPAEATESNVAKEIGVVFSPVGNNQYDIILKPLEERKMLNRYMSSNIAFKMECIDGQVIYEVEPADYMNATLFKETGDSRLNSREYHFEMDGINKPDATCVFGEGIPIGTITFKGYGEFKFRVDTEFVTDPEHTVNIVNTAKHSDNIVAHYTEKDMTAQGYGRLIVNEDVDEAGKPPLKENEKGTIADTLSPDIAALTVNIAFNNTVKNNESAYQDMTLTISGGQLSDDIVIKLGNDSAVPKANVTFDEEASAYKVVVGDTLWRNVLYSVKLEGAGYRTTYHTVMMTGDKTLNFWNNVKDNAEFIEEGKATSEVTKNFLAGDIVDDKNINIYDLSAVVSYFGSAATIENGFAKYDLNRDGVIDSKDVAYVLVSWDE